MHSHQIRLYRLPDPWLMRYRRRLLERHYLRAYYADSGEAYVA